MAIRVASSRFCVSVSIYPFAQSIRCRLRSGQSLWSISIYISVRSVDSLSLAGSSVDSFTCGVVNHFGRVPMLDTIINLHVYAGRDLRCALDGRLSRCTLDGRLPMRPRRTTSMPSTDDFRYALDGRLPRRTTSMHSHSPRVTFAMRPSMDDFGSQQSAVRPSGDFSGLAMCPRRTTFRCAPRRTTSAPNGTSAVRPSGNFTVHPPRMASNYLAPFLATCDDFRCAELAAFASRSE